MLLVAGSVSRADEGMWLLNAPPTAAIKAAYGVDVNRDWLQRMQRAAVRFQTGGSGSVVSANGLVMTNHHVGSDMLLKLSTKERDILRDGFIARATDAELPCPDLELNVLWEIQDVTATVLAAVKDGMTVADAGKARRQAIAEIEAKAGISANGGTGPKGEVVTLYGGARYHLYVYKVYTDVRLVFAPEESAAFFGGDTDNFEFPRYNLDCCFFRIYENGKPVNTPVFLPWSRAGASENEPIFVFGHPGRTERLNTVDHLRITRDQELPRRLGGLWRREIKAMTFGGRSHEHARIIRDESSGVANTRKALTGQLEGLLDPLVIGAKVAAEKSLRDTVLADPQMRAQWGGAWDQVAAVKAAEQKIAVRRDAINRLASASSMIARAVTITQLAAELPKPSKERLREYGDAQLESVYLNLYSSEPIYDTLEAYSIAEALTFAAERLGAEDPLVASLLGGMSPKARAQVIVAGMTLKDPAQRRAMVEGGAAMLAKSKDLSIIFATLLDGPWRAMRSTYEDTIESPLRNAYSQIGAATFAVRGESVYPDATFTLRMSYGAVKGFSAPGEDVPAFTRFGGIYERADERKGQETFVLSDRWLAKRSAVNASVPFNFVCSADIIGGNSGSPVVNAKGEVVGLIFDGNIHSLLGNFAYDGRTNRAVAVDVRGMAEAFNVIYDAKELLAELGVTSTATTPGK